MPDNPHRQPQAGLMGRHTGPRMSTSDAARRHRIAAPEQCRDLRSKLDNLRRLIAAAELEYRTTIRDLDRLDREGRAWLVVDLIHKTSLATLDLGAAIMETTGLRSGAAARQLADGVQTYSDVVQTTTGMGSGTVSPAEAARIAAQRALTHTGSRGAAGTYAMGTADIALSGMDHVDAIRGAQGRSATNARTLESGIDTSAAMVQRVADTAGNRRVSASAQIVRAMASYNRELAGAFDRRLETSGGLRATRANFKATMERVMARYRNDVAEIQRQLADQCS